MTEAASVPSVFTQPNGAIFAMLGASGIGPNLPEWKKIIKIEMTADGPQSTVVQDYTQVPESVQNAVQKAMADSADSDDPPEQQQLLMTAWQALAVYLSECDDEDKSSALQALKMVSDMIGDGGDGPTPTGTFGVTTQTANATAKEKENSVAPKGKNGKPLPPWMAKKQKKMQEKAAYSCPQCSRDFASEGGLISHLKTLHAAREKQAGYGKNPAAQDKD